VISRRASVTERKSGKGSDCADSAYRMSGCAAIQSEAAVLGGSPVSAAWWRSTRSMSRSSRNAWRGDSDWSAAFMP
jgi:hypothetical protein